MTFSLTVKFKEWFEYYFPIEHCHVMAKEEKIPHMVDWWNKTNELIIECGITKENLRECVEKAITHLQANCKDFFKSLEHNNIPLLIFSAGLGDVIAEWIEFECGGRLYSNMKIVSNFMIFDETTHKITGFTDPMIHIFNKNESVLMGTDYEKEIERRPNVMLLGDSLGDVDMSGRGPGFHGRIENLLKIGFLNVKVEEFLNTYMDNFDIVLIDDNTFDVPNAILNAILKE
jgi:HAD superfamily hydrolase (TIGR01544 family)